jgi:hypothetical protein
MSSEDASDKNEPGDSTPDEPDRPDPDEIEPIDADELMEKMQSRRDEQREQVSFDWCETICEAGERYREHGDIDAVADDLQLDPDEVREAVTVYRLRFEEPPGTAAGIADKAGRGFFTLDADIDEVVDLEDRDYTVEDLVREYVGAVYLEYDVDAEPVGDPVEQASPELPIDLEEFQETIADAVSVPAGAFVATTAMDKITEQLTMPTKSLAAAAAIGDMNESITEHLTPPPASLAATAAVAGVNESITEQLMMPSGALAAAVAMDGLNETLAQQLTVPAAELTAAANPAGVHKTQLSAVAASVQPILGQYDQMMDSVAPTAVASITDALNDIVFPESVLADLASIQPAIDAAALSAPTAAAAAGAVSELGYLPVSKRSVSVSDPIPADPDPVETKPAEPAVSPETASVDATSAVEPSADLSIGSSVVATIDATLPSPGMVSSDLVFEIPALLVEAVLDAGEARSWFTGLSYGYQITVVNLMLVSTTYYYTRNASMAALAGFLSPAVRQLIIDEDEE